MGIPVALVATPAYLYAMGVAAVVAERPGLAWMNILVVLGYWNALKFLWMAILLLPDTLCAVLEHQPNRHPTG